MPFRPALAGALLLSLLISAACGAATPAPEPPVLARSTNGAPLVVSVAPVPIPARARQIEMPWVWRVLRREVYARLPRVASRAPRGPNAVFAPVIVDGPYDSVPGVGVEGGF